VPTRSGNPNTARAPARSAAGVKTGHRGVTGSARSGSATTVSCRWASTHGPSPSVYCSSSIRWLTSSLVHNDPRGISPDISITPAPVTPASPGHAPHSQAEDHTPPPAENAATTRCSLSPGISATPSPAQARPTAHNPIVTAHLPPPSPQESASRDWTQRPSGPGPPSLSPPTLPHGQPRDADAATACGLSRLRSD